MPRRLFKRYVPDHSRFREHKHLRFLGELLHDPNLWHLSRRSVPGAVSIGLFVAFVPIPFQMVLAAVLAIPCRVNLPIAVSLVWITNPLTMTPLFIFAYKIGAWMLHIPARHLNFELSFEWLASSVAGVWQPLLLGSFVLGVFSAAIGNLMVRIFWRMHIVKYMRQRRERRRRTAL